MLRFVAVLLLLSGGLFAASGFSPFLPSSGSGPFRNVYSSTSSLTTRSTTSPFVVPHINSSIRNNSMRLNGLFGLGGPEVAIIAVAAAFLLGPSKLAEFSKDLGKVAGELKEVPKEFQKGIAEGEKEAKAIKANEMKPEKVEDVEVKEE